MISFPSCEADTKCLLSVDQCIAYILARWPFRLRRGFMPIRGSTSVCWLATCRTVKTLSAPISTIEAKAKAKATCQIGKTDYTYDDSFIRLLVHTACVCEVILLSLDPVFEAFRFPSCSRDFGLHLF